MTIHQIIPLKVCALFCIYITHEGKRITKQKPRIKTHFSQLFCYWCLNYLYTEAICGLWQATLLSVYFFICSSIWCVGLVWEVLHLNICNRLSKCLTHESALKNASCLSQVSPTPALLILRACHHLSYPSGMGQGILKWTGSPILVGEWRERWMNPSYRTKHPEDICIQ